MLEELLSLNLFAFFLVFARVGTAFFLFPGFQSKQVNIRARLAIALAITFLLTPLLMDILPRMPGSPWMLFALMIGEVLSGAILGTIALITISAVHVAGTVTSFVSAMANALIFDPISQQQSAIVAGFLTTTALLLLFVTDLHHLLIQTVIDSYSLFQPGVLPALDDATHLIVRQIAETFKLGVQLAAPFIVVSIVYNLALGLMTRLAPQIPIFFVALPFQLVVSIVLLMIVVPSIMLGFLTHVEDGLMPFLLPK